MAISHLTYIKDASGLAQAKGLPSLIYHEPAIEVKFMRGAAGTTSILTIRGIDSFGGESHGGEVSEVGFHALQVGGILCGEFNDERRSALNSAISPTVPVRRLSNLDEALRAQLAPSQPVGASICATGHMGCAKFKRLQIGRDLSVHDES